MGAVGTLIIIVSFLGMAAAMELWERRHLTKPPATDLDAEIKALKRAAQDLARKAETLERHLASRR